MGARVRLLGAPAIEGRDHALDLPAGKTSALLCYLAFRHEWVERDTLLGLLYAQSDERRARQNLRALIAKLRRNVAIERLEIEPTRLRWQVETDVAAFQQALTEGRHAFAVELYGGPFLDGVVSPHSNAFHEWLEAVREELAQGWRDAVMGLARSLCEQARYADAARITGRLLELDPFDEEAMQMRLAALARDGRTAVALRTYADFAARLIDELDVQPTAATVRLAEAIRQGHDTEVPRRSSRASADEDQAGKAGVDGHRLLPQPVAPFIGRARELAWLQNHVIDTSCRLVSLVGPGGIGKTALALEVGRRLERAGERPVAFVPLETASDVDGAASLIGDVTGLTFFGRTSASEQVLTALRSRNDVLILDNIEQIAGIAGFIHRLLEAAADVTMLATSRERLGVRAEWVLEVEGLGYRDGTETDAARLFGSAASRVDPTFALPDHRAEVEQICRLVGGMPLAIELAAGWLPVLSPAEIAARLEGGLELLQGEAPDRPARHWSMEAVLDETWGRLSPSERAALASLAVFEGGFTAYAADAVADVRTDQLRGLRRHALLQRRADDRFTFHPLIGRFVRLHTAEIGTWEVLRERHAHYFAHVMERFGAADTERTNSPLPLERQELPNALAAWDWMVDHGRVDLLDRSLDGLSGLALATRLIPAGARAVTRALQAASHDDNLWSWAPLVDTFPLEVRPQKGDSVSCIESVPTPRTPRTSRSRRSGSIERAVRASRRSPRISASAPTRSGSGSSASRSRRAFGPV